MQVQYAAWRQYQPHHTNTIPPYSHVPHNRVHRTALRRPSHSRPVPAPPPVRRTHRLFPLTKRLSAHALRFAQVSSPPTRHRIGVLSLAMSPHSTMQVPSSTAALEVPARRLANTLVQLQARSPGAPRTDLHLHCRQLEAIHMPIAAPPRCARTLQVALALHPGTLQRGSELSAGPCSVRAPGAFRFPAVPPSLPMRRCEDERGPAHCSADGGARHPACPATRYKLAVHTNQYRAGYSSAPNRPGTTTRRPSSSTPPISYRSLECEPSSTAALCPSSTQQYSGVCNAWGNTWWGTCI